MPPFGTWRSLVARSVRDAEVAGSNPAVPTNSSFSPRLRGEWLGPEGRAEGTGAVPSPWMTVDQLPARAVDRLRWVYAALVTASAALVFAAALVAGDVDGGAPGWLGAVVTAAVGVIVLFVVRYYRRRPLEEAGVRDYAVTVLFRAGAAVVPVVVGFGLSLASGEWWVTPIGAAFAVAGLGWAVPSQADYERHRGLAVDIDPHPPDEVWGDVPPGYVAPWEAEPGHGHGLHDH